MRHDMEELLREALSPETEPGDELNQKIIRKAKEAEMMGKRTYRRVPAAALAAAAVIAAGSFTAAAAWKYLAPDKAAEVVEDRRLTEAFQSEDAIEINESQTCGDYKITLLGVVSGKNLSSYLTEHDGEVEEDRTYVVTAIENADGTPRPGTGDEGYGEDAFFVSPLIKGLDPAEFNIVTMNGGYSEFVRNGIQYRIVECDNVEIFADRGLYLCVSSGTFYPADAYRYEKATGEIARNSDFDGVNALFELPLDKAKADPEAAREFIESHSLEGQKDPAETGEQEKENASDAQEKEDAAGAREKEDAAGAREKEDAAGAREKEDASDARGIQEAKAFQTKEELDQNAVLLDALTQTLTPDADGYISYAYKIGDKGMESSGKLLAKSLFPDGETGMSDFKTIMGGEDEDEAYIETYARNEDGSVTLSVYYYKAQP